MSLIDGMYFELLDEAEKQKPKQKPTTNYDRLISKTPEELAEFFFKDPVHLYMKTPQETLDWLKSPVDKEEEGYDR